MTQSPSDRAAQATQAHLSQFSDEDMAYHEAGHAVVHHLNGGLITRLSIERADPRRGTQPARQPSPATSEDSKQALAGRLALLVGGEVAGTLHGTPELLVTAGGRVDHEAALRAAAEAGVGEVEARAMIDAQWSLVHKRLSDPSAWHLVESLAQSLLQHKTLDADQVQAVLTQ